MIAWLTPAGFGAFAALAVPLLIHWLRRSERRVVSFAAERYLREEPHPRENRAWHERVLLVLRLLLLANLALLLAWPVWRGGRPPPPQAPSVVVAPGLDAAAAHAALDAPLADWHWLKEGASLSSQLREIDAALAPGTALTVLVPEDLGGLDAERLQLTHAVLWRALPGSVSVSASAPGTPLTLAVRYDAAGAAECTVVRAVAAAWAAGGQAATVDFAASDAPLPPPTAWLIWLGGDLPPRVAAWIRAGGRALASRQPEGGGDAALSDADGMPILRERHIGAGRLLSLAVPLRPDALPALASARFPQELRALMSRPTEPPDRAPAQSVTPTLRGAPGAGGGPARALAPPFALGVALLFLIERAYATRRRA